MTWTAHKTVYIVCKKHLFIYRSEEIAGVKKTLNIDQEKLKEAFERLEKVIDTELAKLSTEVIPVVNFEDLAKNNDQFNGETVEKIKKYGVVIVRNVIEKEDAKNLLADVEKYMNENGQDPQKKGWKRTIYYKMKMSGVFLSSILEEVLENWKLRFRIWADYLKNN